ncbi:glycosyltransferase [Candidatus Microgenomates bacterium]|nr:glycosyltransferase [Candidatus Microgenomates bacterium]
MKAALVHDYLKEYGGAERVLEALHEIYPQAPIYALFYLPEFLGPHRGRIEKWDIRPLFPHWTPFLSKITSFLRLIAPIMFARLSLSEYDLVIVSATGAYTPNFVKTKPGSHFCYCHTPPRYLYGLPTAREWKRHWWIRVPAEIANHLLRLVDFKSAQRVDCFIANSQNTAQRIKKFYRREAEVIYPPVELQEKHIKSSNGNYFLTGGRLARAKRIDLAVAACTKLGLPLKVFGRMFAGYGEELKKLAGPTIEFLGEVNDEEKNELLANCRAFIFPAEEEDFGIAPVEAMSFGKPVIALRSGGVVESVMEGKTGTFFDKPEVESLIEAIKRFNQLSFEPEDCIAQAQKFSKERFKKEIKEFIEDEWKKT